MHEDRLRRDGDDVEDLEDIIDARDESRIHFASDAHAAPEDVHAGWDRGRGVSLTNGRPTRFLATLGMT